MKYFGITVFQCKYGLKLSKDSYAISNCKNTYKKHHCVPNDIYTDKSQQFYTAKWCEQHRKNCLHNFDLNMHYYASLHQEIFEEELHHFIHNNPYFLAVHDLNAFFQIPGYYLVVLDHYCQLYIGSAVNIAKAIRSHWSKNIPFDRLMFPTNRMDSSLFTIDHFRALDTTRIFAFQTDDIYVYENYFRSAFSPEYSLGTLKEPRIAISLLGYR